jgi:hypothetical protein
LTSIYVYRCKSKFIVSKRREWRKEFFESSRREHRSSGIIDLRKGNVLLNNTQIEMVEKDKIKAKNNCTFTSEHNIGKAANDCTENHNTTHGRR